MFTSICLFPVEVFYSNFRSDKLPIRKKCKFVGNILGKQSLIIQYQWCVPLRVKKGRSKLPDA